jgi:hypothetical protein
MAGLHETAVSLGFFGDDLDPAEVSKLLGATPTFGVSKGAAWRTPRGSERIARTGSWRLQVPRAVPGDLAGQVEAIFAQLTRDTAIWQDLATRFAGRLFCGLFLEEGNEGLRLCSKTLAEIADRGLYLDLDIYAPERSRTDQVADK